ncbi:MULTISPECIES: hypothetical protein [Paenibacillus]|uniref:Uncharacterized protein n=1 Tax=Paenibacillus polymyxa TaxID=1406 RepID=A0ABX2ZB77_PAEPO|nr:hypothetical protein [Paenibacillus polymyxa]ODA07686.1 hypothetical protein A7312_28185 [Paenibacillus polymyxa]
MINEQLSFAPVATKCKCEKCGSFLYEVDYSDADDNYTLQCTNCGIEIRLHYAVYDGWRDAIENEEIFESTAKPIIKFLHKYCTVRVNNRDDFKNNIRNKGTLIQKIDSMDDTDEFYMLEGRYYRIGFNSGEFHPNSDSDFNSFVRELTNLKESSERQ